MRIHTICAAHNFTSLVGPGTLMDELECPACLDEYDAQSFGPCCSRAAIDCCGHGEDPEPGWYVAITSPNYCDGNAYDSSVPPPF